MATLLVGLAAAISLCAPPAHARSVSLQAQASHLAGAVAHAHSASARHRSVWSVMRALHVAVITRTGHVLLRGGPAAARVQLYDFELAALEKQLARHETRSLAALTGVLSSAGLHPTKGDLPPSIMAQLLQSGMRSVVRHPRANGLGALIVRDLGLDRKKGRVDLARPFSDGTQFDALQSELIMLDFANLSARQARAGRAGAAGPVARARPQAVSATLCKKVDLARKVVNRALSAGQGGLAGQAIHDIYGKQVTDEFSALQVGRFTVGEIQSFVSNIVDGVHGALLAYSVRAQAVPDSLPTVHYNHSSAEHHVVHMTVRVTMLDKYGNELIDCGDLAGDKLPKKGGIPGIPINWSFGGLLRHSSLSYQFPGADSLSQGQTDANGVATLDVPLKTELVPGRGLEKEDTGVTDAIPQVGQATAGSKSFANIASYLFPKDGVNRAPMRWHVSYHDTPPLVLRYTHSSHFSGDYRSSGSGSTNDLKTDRTFALSSSIPLVLADPTANPATPENPTSISGAAPLDWTSATGSWILDATVSGDWNGQPYSCTLHTPVGLTQPFPGTARVLSGTLTPPATDGASPTISNLHFGVQGVHETWHSHQDASQTGTPPPGCTAQPDEDTDQPTYTETFLDFWGRQGALVGGGSSDPVIQLDDSGWAPGSGDVIATRTIQDPAMDVTAAGSYGEGSGSYTDTFELIATQ